MLWEVSKIVYDGLQYGYKVCGTVEGRDRESIEQEALSKWGKGDYSITTKRFTKQQYEKAIELLKLGMTQLEPDGHCCAVCGDDGHSAHACHHNPLRAIQTCNELYNYATDFHEALHGLIGANSPIGLGIFAVMPREDGLDHESKEAQEAGDEES